MKEEKVHITHLMSEKNKKKFIREFSKINQQEHNGVGIVSFVPSSISHIKQISIKNNHEHVVIDMIIRFVDDTYFNPQVHRIFGKSYLKRLMEIIAEFCEMQYKSVQHIFRNHELAKRKIYDAARCNMMQHDAT